MEEETGLTRRTYQSQGDIVENHAVSVPDRSYLYRIIFAPEAGGRSLLDIGCNLGLFCREAARRGLTAIGIDTDPDAIRGAVELASGLENKPEYVLGDFEEHDWRGSRFDTVIALNVLHHMFDPIHALRVMNALARRRIILEVAQPTWRDRKLVLRSPSVLFARWMPIMWLDHTRKPRRVGSRTFLFTRRALSVLFNEHTTIFEPLRFHRSPFKDRLIVEARKREIGHLVVVAGPTSSGKSTFLDRFLRDGEFRKTFVADEGDWVSTTAYKVGELPTGRLERVVLHYDMLRLLSGSLKSFGRDPNLDILQIAEKLTVVTVACDRGRLISQLEKGPLSRPKFMRRRRHLKLRELYLSQQFLARWYRAWFDFCRSFERARIVLVENNGEFVPRPLEALEDVLR